MKSALFIILGFCSFQTHALTAVADLKEPIKFQFSEDIQLKPEKAKADGVAYAFLHLELQRSPNPDDIQPTSKLEIYPGLNTPYGAGCTLQKKDPDGAIATIHSATHGGSEWTIQLVNYAKSEPPSLGENSNAPVLNDRVGLMLGLTSYTAQFALKNAEGTTQLQMQCKANCPALKFSGRDLADKVCQSVMSARTVETLKQLGINVPVSKNNISFQIPAGTPLSKIPTAALAPSAPGFE